MLGARLAAFKVSDVNDKQLSTWKELQYGNKSDDKITTKKLNASRMLNTIYKDKTVYVSIYSDTLYTLYIFQTRMDQCVNSILNT